MNIKPIQPTPDQKVAEDSKEIPQTGVGRLASRRTFGTRIPSRRTFGARVPSRRTFGRNIP